ncbi:MAG: zinc ribbon domain-containing protein, partial [Acidimicrobiia bacterium]|nr:zinc ribbon domain-containing protein [Acidimicrobiia bacterium]
MTSCTSCGHESASTARFCSECGLPLVSPRAAGAEVISGTDKSHWLTSTDQSHDAAVRAPGVRRGLTHPLRLLAVGVVLAFVVWNLFRAPTTEVEGLAGDLDAATATTPTSASTADSGAADAAVDEGGSTSTTVDPDQSTVDVSDLDSALTRYHVFAQHSGRLLRVDLADGQVDVYDVTGRMVGDFAGLLYLVDPRNAIVTLPVDDLDAEPSPNASPVPQGHSLAAVELTGDGLLHLMTGLFSAADPEFTMIRIDL